MVKVVYQGWPRYAICNMCTLPCTCRLHWGVTAQVRSAVSLERQTDSPWFGACSPSAPAEAKCQHSFGQCLDPAAPELRGRKNPASSWPQIRQGYPLNLSILISEGKKTNKDSLSNGEWSRKSSNLKSPMLASASCSCEKHFLGGSTVPKLLGTARRREWQPRLWCCRPLTMCFQRVGLFGNAA